MGKKQKLLYGKDARDRLASGSQKLADAVVSTLGPRSKNVAINSKLLPIVVHDGVTVARGIKLEDSFEDMGAQLLKQAAAKTNDLAGDGTTTATLIANTLIQKGMELIGGKVGEGIFKSQVNSMELRERLIEASEEICKSLDKSAKLIKTGKEREAIATISAQNKEIGKLVSDAIEKVGNDGIIMVEEASGFEDVLEIQEGMEWDNGFLSAYFMNDPAKMICEYHDGYILITDYTISDPNQIAGIIEDVRKDNDKPLLIVANDVVGSALHTMVLSKLQANYKLCAVISPDYGERRKESLEDLAILTGGEVISHEVNRSLNDVEIKDLGRFRRMIVNFKKTQITPANPDKDEIEDRIKAIKELIKKEDNNFIREKYRQRLTRLGQNAAIIKVGGMSESETRERRERFIDAIHATKAAISEGIVSGGGIALMKLANDYDDLIAEALRSPYETIIKNAGIENGSISLEEIKNGIGYDVISKEKKNMIDAGIIDPVKVTKLAVKNAFSVAAMILTTDVLVTDADDNEK